MQMESRDALERLLDSEVETDVEDVIGIIEDEFDVKWQPLGDRENNSGMVEVQKGTPVGALAELIVNSKDAILQKNYIAQYGDTYDESHDLNSYLEAADHFLDDDHDEFVQIIADGEKSGRDQSGELNLTLRDSGKGQGRDHFDNFVDIMEVGLNKQQWPFSQGMFGMGSHASLRFCGDDEWNGSGYKLIASAAFDQPGEWSWTLIRRNPDAVITFEYLTFDGEFPTVDGEVLGEEYGTIVKLYNYQLEKKSEITKTEAMRGVLDLELLQNAIPINLLETRYDRDIQGVLDIETEGAYARLIEADEVKSHFERQLTSKRLPDFLQETKLDVFLLHTKDECEERDDLSARLRKELKGGSHHEKNSIIFAANGERHAALSHYYLRRRCDLYHTAKDVIVFVDLSELSGEELRQLFSPSRDGLQESSEIAEKLKEMVIEQVKNIEPLREEEMRRQADTNEKEYEEQIAETLEDMMSDNPEIRRLLRTGEVIPESNRKDGDEDTEYERTDPPTVFRAIETYRPRGENAIWAGGTPMDVEVPVNRNRWVRFELNAPNGYFNDEREGASGELLFEPEDAVEGVLESWGVNDGILNVEVSASEQIQPGMELPITFTVTRPDGENLTENINIQFTPEEEIEEQEDTDDEDESTDGEVDTPNIVGMGLDSEWFDSEDDIVEIVDYDDQLQIVVNTDSTPLESFLTRNKFRTNATDIVTDQYVMGIGLYAFGAYQEQLEHSVEEDVAENVSELMKGMAPFFVAYHFDQDQIDQLTV